MRILLLTQWFEPEPTFKGLLFARELAARGHDVEVLTGFPNYPGGDVYPGYRIRPWVREQIDGISILRVALYPNHDKSGFRRALNYVSFAISAAVIGTALVRKPDVVYVYSPPATIGFPAVALGLLRRVPFVYDICDLWPDTIAVSGMLSSPVAFRLLHKWCEFVYRRARHIVVLSPGFKQQLVRRGVPPDKIDVIYSWCDENSVCCAGPGAPGKDFGLQGRLNVVFAGTMGFAQALDTVLGAARMCTEALPSVQFVFVGGGVELTRLRQQVENEHLRNVRFLPRMPMSEIGNLLALADALLVHLKDDPLFRITIPSKTQAYLAAGRPMLMGVRGDAADLVLRSGAGLVFQPENADELCSSIRQLLSMSPQEREEMGRRGQAYYREHLSRAAGTSRFEQVFARCIVQ
jgi:glycosyltransferase involved in cell wall biosynthesis